MMIMMISCIKEMMMVMIMIIIIIIIIKITEKTE